MRVPRNKPAIAAAVVLGAGALLYGYNVYRNVSGGARARAACDRFVAATRATQAATHAWSARVFPDAAAVERDNVGGAEDLCGAVEARLAWWRWNLWTPDFQPPRDSARDSRLRIALDAASKRCPTVARGMLDASPAFQNPKNDDEKQAMESQKRLMVNGLCKLFTESRSRLDDPPPSLPIDQWPARLEQVAGTAEKLLQRPHRARAR